MQGFIQHLKAVIVWENLETMVRNLKFPDIFGIIWKFGLRFLFIWVIFENMVCVEFWNIFKIINILIERPVTETQWMKPWGFGVMTTLVCTARWPLGAKIK